MNDRTVHRFAMRGHSSRGSNSVFVTMAVAIAIVCAPGLTGCAVLANGSVHRGAAGGGSPALGPRMVARRERLVALGPRSNPGSASALARGHWSVLARSPLGTRNAPIVVWDGHELIEFGGTAGSLYGGGAPRDGGAAYDPADGRWQRVASVPAVVEPATAAWVWTGRQVFVFGGPPSSHEFGRGCCVAGLYDPARDRWTLSAKAPFGQLSQLTAVWTGEDVVLAGIVGSVNDSRLEVARYDPATDTWTALNPPISARHPPLALAMVSTDDGVLVWSLWGRGQPTGPGSGVEYSGVDVFRLRARGTWIDVTGSWPQHHTVDEPVFTGREILLAPGQIWCGLCSHPAPFDEHGDLVDPVTLRLTAIPSGPLDDLGPQIVWTGDAEISLNAGGEITGPGVNVLPGDIAIWNPQTRRWTRAPRAPRQLIYGAPAAWGATQLFVLAADGHLLAYGNGSQRPPNPRPRANN